MILERGTIIRINARGRVTVQLADRRVDADIQSGSGGCVDDMIEGDMRLGLRSWRNVGNSILSVVQVIAIEPVPGPAPEIESGEEARLRRAGDAMRFRPDERWLITRRDHPSDDQYNSRKLS